MIVADLEAICQLLPADLAVHIVSHGPCGHVQEVDWHARRKPHPRFGLSDAALVDGRYPQALVLRSYADGAWWTAFGADVPFTPRGLLERRLGYGEIQPGTLQVAPR